MAAALQVVSAPAVRSQTPAPDSSKLMKAMLLESDGKYKEAAPLYRSSLRGADIQSAFLGLERVYAELGWTDSLLAPLDSLLKASPTDPIFREAQLRSLNTLGKQAELRQAFESWINAAPADPAPYREYA